ncbi:MAG: hypothetical protein WBD91_12470, partial [Acidobacteriaceae bacterium]
MNGRYSEAVGWALRVYAAGSLSREIEAHSNPRKLEEAVVLDLELITRADFVVLVLPDGIVVERAEVVDVGGRCAEVSL